MIFYRFRRGKLQPRSAPVILLLAVTVATAACLLVNHVVSRTKSGFPAVAERVTGIRMVRVTGRALILNSGNDYHDAIPISNQLSVRDFHVTFSFKSNELLPVDLGWNAGRNWGADRGFAFWDLERGKPGISINHRLGAHKYRASRYGIERNGLAVVDERHLGLNRLAHQAPTGLHNRNNERSVGLNKLFSIQRQSIGGSFGKLLGRLEHSVGLGAAISHFIELPVHRMPLESSDKSADDSRKSNDKREWIFRSTFSNPFFKIFYLLLLSLVAVEVGARGMKHFDTHRSCGRRHWWLIVSLFVFFAACFHVAWVVVF